MRELLIIINICSLFYLIYYIFYKQIKNMKKHFIWFFLIVFGFATKAQENLWTSTSLRLTDHLPKMERNSHPTRSEIYHLDLNELKTALDQAPKRGVDQNSLVFLKFPMHDGNMETFQVYNAPVMHPDLAAKFPNIHSYVGFGTTDKTAMIRFSVTLFGFHGFISSGKTGSTYIDTYTKDLDYYIVYNKKNIVSNRSFECLVEDEPSEEIEPVFFSPRNTNSINANSGIFRTYRLAMACTIEFSAFHINAAGANNATLEAKKAVVLAAMNVTMTRVNGIFEKDMALTMQLIPNNDEIIFIDSDSFNNNNSSQLINQSQTVINSFIGSANYDIGHTVSTGGGGLAQLNSPCTNSKARGITGASSPVGDPFDVDYVAHEMGHQYGATHTFNNSCDGNISNATAVEPGSGSTIMAYAGICAPNVQNNSDPHFHAVSLAQMDNFVAGIGDCSENQQNFNTAPVINFIPNYTIPASTPFFLPGNATDTDNDVLTFCWEQTNNNISQQPPVSTSASGPNFRSLPPSSSPVRYLPQLPTVLLGSTQDTWEVVPDVSRTMNFALVVRDNVAVLGGQTARRNMTVTTHNTGQAFTVTSQNQSNVTWLANESHAITWNVAGTTSAPINTQNVKILLSTDGGQNFDIVLLESTPNDGNENIVVPNNISSQFCRIMVQGVGNIFYNVNTTPFSIGVDCEQFTNDIVAIIPDGNGNNVAGQTIITELNVEAEGIIEEMSINLDLNHTWIGDLVIEIEHPDGTSRRVWNRSCNNTQFINIQASFRDNSQNIVCGSPTSGTFNPNQSFDVFLNKPKAGIWKLKTTDFYTGDVGTINSWSIDFGCTSLSNSNFAENKFSVYPNPNNGQFVIKNELYNASPIDIKIYDISGRLVHQVSYRNSNPEININLSAMKTGTYLLLMSNEEINETHRILIQ